MIAIERRGWLGNNMFQWAFGISASRRLGTRFTTDHEPLSPIFELDGEPSLRWRLRRLRWRAGQRLQQWPTVEIDGDDDPRDVMAGLRDGVRYGGFFQSADYFGAEHDAVRRAFTVRREHRDRFRQEFADLVGADYVCLHVRRRDYLVWGGSGIELPWSYFHRCLELAGIDAPAVFTSDDIAAVRAEFASQPGARFEANDPIIDMQLMMHAKVCVVSNSSFSWWGAWLNRHPDKRVLAPQHWLGFKKGREWPCRVIPDNWTQVAVDYDN
jgi:Glycosyl transferase family 11